MTLYQYRSGIAILLKTVSESQSGFSSFMTFVKRVTRLVPHNKQELPTFQRHPSSTWVFSGAFVAWSLVFCVVFCRSLVCPVRSFIVLSALLGLMASDLPLYGIFKFFINECHLWSIKCWSSRYDWKIFIEAHAIRFLLFVIGFVSLIMFVIFDVNLCFQV